VDDTVVPRGAWGRTEIRPGMRVEVVTAVQGG
jgi:thiamine biosynthesis protein ThiS